MEVVTLCSLTPGRGTRVNANGTADREDTIVGGRGADRTCCLGSGSARPLVRLCGSEVDGVGGGRWRW